MPKPWLPILTLTAATLLTPAALRAQDDAHPPPPPPPPPEEGPRDHEHDRDHRPHFAPLDVDEAIAVLREIKPELADRLEAQRAEDPERAERVLHREFPRLRYLIMLKHRAPEMYALRVQDVKLAYRSHDLAKQLRDAAQDEALRQELRAVVLEHFEVRQRIRERELAMLEQRIEELRDQLDARTEERDELIEQRVAELMGEASDAEW